MLRVVSIELCLSPTVLPWISNNVLYSSIARNKFSYQKGDGGGKIVALNGGDITYARNHESRFEHVQHFVFYELVDWF